MPIPIVSDWNNGNAHFLRGILGELAASRACDAGAGAADGWSRSNLIADQGQAPLQKFAGRFPELHVVNLRQRF